MLKALKQQWSICLSAHNCYIHVLPVCFQGISHEYGSHFKGTVNGFIETGDMLLKMLSCLI